MSYVARYFCDSCGKERPRVDFAGMHKPSAEWTKEQQNQWKKHCEWADIIVKDPGKLFVPTEFSRDTFANEFHLCPYCIAVFRKLVAKGKSKAAA